ncbi:hypothetical protein CCMSSC00406_0008112 [Pleurotus cornucopiae]|uniref:Uncharacterized protein n=1 Tax=Pleurotus cornucopiae TaxID=5321 RepID=A0ACB7IKX8_PLECO|nr:hypothetical protein CCMSSC00406_0008112 [Pleurotus cornucopiae]
MSSRISKFLLFFVVLSVLAPIRAPIRVYGAPTPALLTRHEGHEASASTGDFKKQNGMDAQKLNAQFAGLKKADACNGASFLNYTTHGLDIRLDGEQACVETSFAQCVGGKWALTPCASGTVCVALPLVNKPGTSIACDSENDATARILAAGVEGGLTGSDAASGSASAGTGGDDDELECDDDDEPSAPLTNGDDDLECDDDEAGSPASSSAAVTFSAASTSSVASASSVSASVVASATALQKNTKPAATTIFLNSPSPSSVLSKRQFGLTSVAIIPVPETTTSSVAAVETPAVSALPQTIVSTSVSASIFATSPAVVSTPQPVTIISSVAAAPAPASTAPAGGVTTVTAVIFSTVTVTVGASSVATLPISTSAPAVAVTPASSSIVSSVVSIPSILPSSSSPIVTPIAFTSSSSATPAVFFSFASPAPAATSSLSDAGNINLAPTPAPAPNTSPADAAEIARLLTATL